MKIQVVGAGIAGLTAAAFLAKEAREDWEISLFEYSATPGGLVKGRWKNGFYLDQGIRAFENAGVLIPMLKNLGIQVSFLPNPVSLGVGDDLIRYRGLQDLDSYLHLLEKHFPDEHAAISNIGKEIKKVANTLHVLYSSDNPLFYKDEKSLKTLTQVIPWLLHAPRIMKTMKKRQSPVRKYLALFTKNSSLIDLLIQHFFAGTPAFFALSYFGMYGEYQYPEEGTGALTEQLLSYLEKRRVRLYPSSPVLSIDPNAKTLRVRTQGTDEVLPYDVLIWACDPRPLENAGIIETKSGVQKPSESVLTLSIGLDLPPAVFLPRIPGHSFWTPSTQGISSLGPFPGTSPEERPQEQWIQQYMKKTTYEISIPALRNPHLAPPGQTGLIISTILSEDVEQAFYRSGREESFRQTVQHAFIQLIEQLQPHSTEHLLFSSLTTPCDVERYTWNAGGAISGWRIPADRPKDGSLMEAIQTKDSHVYQAGQWTYQPAGVPVSILTGKLAADAVIHRFQSEKTNRW